MVMIEVYHGGTVQAGPDSRIAEAALTPYVMLRLPQAKNTGDTMAAEIRLFPCLSDNYGYLVHDPATNATASIDAPEAAPIIETLEREGWTLRDILVTHHHGDHVGGIAELKQKYHCRVVAPHDKTAKIPQVDLRVRQGDVVKVGTLLARVLETPGHTLDHISYVFDDEKALFAADTLFSIGCGRVFEGDYPMMWDSLLKLRALPDDFRLYCGHEYTAANVKFALTVEPDNAALKARAEEVTRLRAAGKPTIPTLLGEEKQANVFLRADDPAVAAALRLKGASPAEVFGELRERKNKS
jgi:hydroxyacylglutathione hydrolase